LGGTQIRSYISFCAGGGGPPRREEDGAEASGQPALREAGQELRHWSGGAPFPCRLSPSSLKQYFRSLMVLDSNGLAFPDTDWKSVSRRPRKCPPKKGRSIILKSFQFGWRKASPEP
jgi:hypothetical protein